MKEYNIEELYQQGGYKLIYEKFGNSVMPKNSSKLMSKESYKRWLRYLRWRWCQANPEFIKRQNKFYSDKRTAEKPYVVICKRCGKEFNAPRSCYKTCPDCQKIPSKNSLYRKEVALRRERKQQLLKEVKSLYKKGITQQNIAKLYGVSQKTVSNYLKK